MIQMQRLRLIIAAALLHLCGAKVCDIRKHGATGTGSTLDTDAIKAAIADCSDGGTILVPAAGGCQWRNLSSCYLTGAFNLTSHQRLEVEKDAAIVGSIRERPH
eukprot:COSAG04_NODE_15556_length_528_cov_0.843823_1_plen_103_part_10